MAEVFTFKTAVSRRLPDPVYHKSNLRTEKHIFLVNVRDLPLGIGNDANARSADGDLNREVYREVEASLLERQAGSPLSLFHHKNKGITILAESVEQLGNDLYKVTIDPSRNQGVVDGGHTYRIITTHIEAGDLPDNQFVEVNVRVGIDPDWHPFIAGGLNTGIQVPQANLADLSGYFQHLKGQLKPFGIDKAIAWRVEDGGVPVRDVLSYLLLFNVGLYPTDKTAYPIESYTSKASVLKAFRDKLETFNRMPDQFVYEILTLRDFVNVTAADLWNDGTGKFGRLEWSEYRDRNARNYKPIEYPFIGKQADYGLAAGALYPILGAFRWLVGVDNKTLKMGWRIPFEDVKNTWLSIGREMMEITQENSLQLGRNPNALGKSKPLWQGMFNTVKANRPF